MKTLTPERRAELLHDIKMRVGLKRWICETLREQYDQIQEIEDDELKERMTETLIIAYDMAKRMNAKLIEYKADYDKGMSEPNYKFKQLMVERSERAKSERG